MTRHIITGAGKLYGLHRDGSLEQVADDAGAPDFRICRRVVDFPGGQVPAGGAVDDCARCGARVVFNPTGPHQAAPVACMQCCGIAPLPIERPQ